MKIVDRKTFLSLPPDTVFSKFSPCILGELHIKGETLGSDFLAQDIAGSIECNNSQEYMETLLRAPASGESVSMDFDVQCRDGLFDADQLFAVWERRDVAALVARLSRCLGAET